MNPKEFEFILKEREGQFIELGLPQPVFEYNSNFATILLDKTKGKGAEDGVKDGVKLTLNQEKILEKVTENSSITAEELSRMIGINKRNVEKNLSKLQELNVIKRIGSDKSGHWEVKK